MPVTVMEKKRGTGGGVEGKLRGLCGYGDHGVRIQVDSDFPWRTLKFLTK